LKLKAELKVFTLRDYAVTQLLHVSNIFKISSSDWLNYSKPSTQHLKDAIFAFSCLAGL